jgi:hypothetical protein
MTRTSAQVLQEEFLIARCKIIELAATLDRIDRAARESDGESLTELQSKSSALKLLAEGIKILQEPDLHRAQRVQELMSRPYQEDWRKKWTI